MGLLQYCYSGICSKKKKPSILKTWKKKKKTCFPTLPCLVQQSPATDHQPKICSCVIKNSSDIPNYCISSSNSELAVILVSKLKQLCKQKDGSDSIVQGPCKFVFNKSEGKKGTWPLIAASKSVPAMFLGQQLEQVQVQALLPPS